jgi:hypothetical protein
MVVWYLEALAAMALSLSVPMAGAWLVQQRTGNSGWVDTIARRRAPHHEGLVRVEPGCLKRVDRGNRQPIRAAVSPRPSIARGAMSCRSVFLPKTIMPAAASAFWTAR